MPSSGNCSVILESLTFSFWGKIKPSLHDLDSRVTQGMSEVGFLPNCVSELDLGKKKNKHNECLHKAMPLGFFLLLLLV